MLVKYNFAGSGFFLLASLFFILSCSDDDIDVTELQPTELEVTVLNSNGESVPNAEVRLYRTQRDFELLSKEIARGQTGSDGKVLLSDLQPVNYYVYASYRDESAGLIRSNYGNYNDEYFDSYSNISLYDYLTENGLTKVSVSTLFSKPISPTSVTIEGLEIIHTAYYDEFSNNTPDTSLYIFAMVSGFELFFDDTLNSSNIISYSYDTLTFYADPNQNVIGEGYYIGFENELTFDLNQLLSDDEFGFFDPPLSLLPLVYIDSIDQFVFEGTNSDLLTYLDFEFRENLLRARKSGDYANRVNIAEEVYYGNSAFVMDFTLSWN